MWKHNFFNRSVCADGGEHEVWRQAELVKVCDSKHSQHEGNHLLGGDSDTYDIQQA